MPRIRKQFHFFDCCSCFSRLGLEGPLYATGFSSLLRETSFHLPAFFPTRGGGRPSARVPVASHGEPLLTASRHGGPEPRPASGDLPARL